VSPRSSIAEVSWPAVPADSGARLLALLQQLSHSQWWTPDRLRAHQLRQLGPLLAHAFRAIPFYRARLEAAGYRPDEPITPEFWSRLPVLDRRDVQEQGAAITCSAVPEEHGRLISDATSGSTGTPLVLLKTELAQTIWYAIALRQAVWCAADFRLKFAAIRRDRENRAFPPDGRRYPDWAAPVATVFPTGPAAVLDNRCTPQEQAEWLLREEPDYLLIYPSVAQELARYCYGRDLRFRRLKMITTMGEVLTPRVREACREAFGVGITDMYSASETGYLALQCPHNEHYHAQSETALLEVLDEAGQPCGPGQVGTVVVTPLHNYAMPLLRYALGDLAEVGGACSCGRGLPVLTEILGRARDTVMLPSGSRRYAWVGLRRLGEIREVVQFQVVQRTLYDLEIKLVVRQALGAEKEEKIRQTLRDSLGAHFSVTVTYHDAIPRTQSGKYFDFVSEVPG
jgi:phenylacetate-CoA ligase